MFYYYNILKHNVLYIEHIIYKGYNIYLNTISWFYVNKIELAETNIAAVKNPRLWNLMIDRITNDSETSVIYPCYWQI